LDTDDDLLELYSRRLQARAVEARRARRLERPDATVERVSRLCGSRIVLDLNMRDGAVTAIGYRLEACMLGEAGAAVLAEALPGRPAAEARAVAQAVRRMLETPDAPLPGGPWADLELLRPAIDLKNRHGSVLLPFDAVVEAIEMIERTRAGST
jgi:NifU-like protein involved in Fe-S cluster formation